MQKWISGAYVPLVLVLIIVGVAVVIALPIFPPDDDDAAESPADGDGVVSPRAEPGVPDRYPTANLRDTEPAVLPDHGPDSGLPPNELGSVMVLMYHGLGETEGAWRRSFDNFRSDLEYLYEKGYRPVSLASYLSGRMDLPAGMTPVILTFDDGLSSHLRWKDGIPGEPHPDTAAAMLLDFAEENPGFDARAVFYLNSPRPFSPMSAEDVDHALNWLVDHGFELGNHTHWHANLRDIPDGEVREVIALTEAMITGAIPGYRVQSLALPFGLWPQNRDLAIRGSHRDISYDHEAIMLVGARPAPSPFSVDFNPLSTPRVKASTPEMDRWFGEMERNPGRRYVSDGSMVRVTVPEGLLDRLDETSLGGRRLRVIEPTE